MDVRLPPLFDRILNPRRGERMSFVNKEYFGENFKKIFIDDEGLDLIEFYLYIQRLFVVGSFTDRIASRTIKTVFYIREV